MTHHTCTKHQPGTPTCYSKDSCRCDACRKALSDQKRTRRQCSIPDCEGPTVGRGWCKKHWTRWRRHGNPLHDGLAVRTLRRSETVTAADVIASAPPAIPMDPVPIAAVPTAGAHLVSLVRYGMTLGLSVGDIAAYAGYRSSSTLCRSLARAGRADIARRLLKVA